MEDAEDPLAPQPSDYDFMNSQYIKTYKGYQFSASNYEDHADNIDDKEGKFFHLKPLKIKIEPSSELIIDSVFSLNIENKNDCNKPSFLIDKPSKIKLASDSDEALVVNISKTYKCDECDYDTRRRHNLKRHREVVHLGIKHFWCILCKYKTNKRSDYKKHIYSKHNKNNTYKCDECEYISPRMQCVKIHKGRAHLDSKRLTCHYCNYKTDDKRQLREHIHRRKLKNRNLFKCSECCFHANYSRYLIIHYRQKHPIVAKERIRSRDSLVSDVTNNSDNTKSIVNKIYKCDQCEYSSPWRKCLKKHKDVIHFGIKPYKCDLCQYKTVDKRTLKEHIHGKHMSYKPFKCSECNFSTSSSRYMPKHHQIKHPAKAK